MANLCVIANGVNLRADPNTSAAVKLYTTAPRNYGVVFGKAAPSDSSGYPWLEIRGDDGMEAWVRSDVVWRLAGDFTLLGGGVYDDWKSGAEAFPSVAAAPVQAPAIAPNAPPASAGKWACPCNPSTNENGYGHVYAGVKHDGVDLAGPLGSPIVASAKGVVFLAQKSAHGKQSVFDAGVGLNNPAVLNDEGWNYGYANVVIVRYDRASLPTAAQASITTAYVFVLTAHCDDLIVTTGSTVYTGAVIAHRGQSGNANGSHVHLAVLVSNDPSPANVWALPRVDPGLVFQLPAAT